MFAGRSDRSVEAVGKKMLPTIAAAAAAAAQREQHLEQQEQLTCY